MRKTALVTGGTGFLAGWLIVGLLQRGIAVRTTVRDLSSEASLRAAVARVAPAHELRVVRADLLADDGWAEAAEGADCVFHVASPMSGEDVVTPAREGTQRVLHAALRARVPHLLLTSSAEAAKAAAAHVTCDEAIWTDTTLGDTRPYVLAKTQAERDAWDVGERHPELALTTILPGFMLGPVLRDGPFPSVALIRQMISGAFPALPRLSFPVVDVRDVAELHIRAMLAPAARGERFIGAGETLSMLGMATILKDHLGERAARAPATELPDTVVRQAAASNSFLREMLPELGLQRRFSAAKAEQLLDWRPRTAAESIIAAADPMPAVGR
ncbi:MAG: NAD-dependent epimerase/dehydratase family protein [Variovorax sp.]|nr:NAD-dependent epimerase/dehydratase family protein [Variovorax sp.]